MKTRSQTRNEALKTKSTVEKTKPVTRSSNPITLSITEKRVTRSSKETPIDTSVHLTNSMNISPTLDRVVHKPPKPILYEPIDFDDASACWRMNKQSLGNGQYKYVCAFMKIDNTRCGRNVKKGCMACRFHV
jgi:hypothetical protein